MWSFVNCKSNQRWLWLALDHNTRTIVAYTLGKCKDAVFAEFRKILEPNDLNQAQLAKILNIAQTTYSNYENGNREIPISILIELSKFYNVSVDYLLGLIKNSKPYPKR